MFVLLEMTCATQLLYLIPWPAHPNAHSLMCSQRVKGQSEERKMAIDRYYIGPNWLLRCVNTH